MEDETREAHNCVRSPAAGRVDVRWTDGCLDSVHATVVAVAHIRTVAWADDSEVRVGPWPGGRAS